MRGDEYGPGQPAGAGLPPGQEGGEAGLRAGQARQRGGGVGAVAGIWGPCTHGPYLRTRRGDSNQALIHCLNKLFNSMA